MDPIAQPKAANPLKDHALGVIRMSGYIAATASILFLASLPFTPHSAAQWAYWFTALATGVAGFALLRRHWCRPNNFLFIAIIMLLIFSRAGAERAFFPELRGSISWPLLMQFLCLYFVAELSLVYVFRRRILESINRQSTVA
jgi:hypothetical protein